VAEQCHAAGVIFVFACSWTKVAHVDKFRGHFFTFASSWTKVAHDDKFKGHFRVCKFMDQSGTGRQVKGPPVYFTL